MALATDQRSSATRVMERCARLAEFTEEPGHITRTYLSSSMLGLHREVSDWMREAGLEVRVDNAGNIVGRRLSGTRDAKVFTIGSHLDTVPNAGRYDGILGVIVGIEAAGILRHESLPFDLEVVGFSEEEGVRFNMPFIGSRAYAGTFDSSLLSLSDAHGETVADAIRFFGLNPDMIGEAAVSSEDLLGFLEVHIEQGPVLQQRGMPVAAVEHISGQTRLHAVVTGETRHAGTTPMNARHDALAGASEIVLAVERLGIEGAADVMTVGRLVVSPNVPNCVPGSVALTVDIRHAEDARRAKAEAQLMQKAERIATDRGLMFHLTDRRETPCVLCNGDLTDCLAESIAVATEQPAFRHFSGAGHDTMVMAQVTRTAMLFVRCRDGISHNPEESVTIEDVGVAVEATVDFLRRLGRRAS